MDQRDSHIDNDTLAAYAMDALQTGEVAELAVHLAHCSDCQRELATLRAASALIPYGLPAADPPPALRERILDRARQSRRVESARTVRAKMTSPRRHFSWWPRLAPVLAALGVIVVFLLWRSWPGTPPDIARRPDARSATLSGQAAGMFVVTPSGREARLSVSGLPPLGEERVYQLWLLGGTAPVSAGTFTADQKGRATVELAGIAWSPTYTGVAITPEPRGGLPAPSGTIVAHGSF